MRRAVRQAQFLKLTTVGSLAAVLNGPGPARGRAKLARIIATGAAPTQSELEDAVLDLLLRNGFAHPLVNEPLFIEGRRIVPDLLVGVTPEELARLAAAAFAPVAPPQVTTTHIAPPRLSVAEAVATLARRLQDRRSSSFEDLVGRQAEPIEVVIGLLAVLELYKRSLVELDQTSTFGDIAVHWTGGDLVDPIDMTVEEPP